MPPFLLFQFTCPSPGQEGGWRGGKGRNGGNRNVPTSRNPSAGPAFHSYFEIFNGPGEVDMHSLQNVLLIVGISLTPAQVEDALMSADIDGE